MANLTNDILARAKKFRGKVDESARTIEFDKPIKIRNRADALDILFLLTAGDNWMCYNIDKSLKALRRFIEKMPEGESA
jgi:hypothetical protein